MRIPGLQLITSAVLACAILAFATPSEAWPRRDFDRDSRTPDDVLGQHPGTQSPKVAEGAHEPGQARNGIDLVDESEPLDVPSMVNGYGGIRQAVQGFAHPVRWMKLMRGFDGNNCWHQGLDIASLGPHAGVGQPIYSIVKAKVIFIGTPEISSARYGRRDRRGGMVKRGRVMIPRRMKVDGYPTIYPFTRGLGTAKTGVFIITKAMHPRIDRYSVRYMHLAAVRPGLKVGDIVDAGEEIGVMGSTAILESMPHLHLDIETPSGRRVDPAHLLGVGHIVGGRCRSIHKRAIAAQRRQARKRRQTRKRRRSSRRRHSHR